jgi:ribosome-associated protein
MTKRKKSGILKLCKADRKGPSITNIQAKHDEPAMHLKDLIIKSLHNDKAEDLLLIDLEEKSYIADYMIIVTGTSTRHLQSMAKHLIDKTDPLKNIESHIEGLEKCEWVLFDAGDVIVHLFLKDVRKFYDLERIWCFEQSETPEKITSKP